MKPNLLVDFDGTIAKEVTRFRPLYMFIERFFPLIKILIPENPTYEWIKTSTIPRVVILTATQNRIGTLAWLKVRRYPYHSIIFVDSHEDKKPFRPLGRYIDADE